MCKAGLERISGLQALPVFRASIDRLFHAETPEATDAVESRKAAQATMEYRPVSPRISGEADRDRETPCLDGMAWAI